MTYILLEYYDACYDSRGLLLALLLDENYATHFWADFEVHSSQI